MQTRLKYKCSLAAAAVLANCLAYPSHAADPRSGIEAVNTEFASAAGRGDSAAVAALYANDAQLLPAASEPVVGRAAIEKFWQGALQSGITQVSLKTVELYGSGVHCTEVGRYELHDKGGKLLDRGKYIVIWQRERGEWKLLRDMFSTNLPPPAR